jgi:hypothetical protein
MNQLQEYEAGLEQAVERTRQHYLTVHSDIRVDIINTLDKIAQIESTAALMPVGDRNFKILEPEIAEEAEAEAPKKISTSKAAKRLYMLICNLCHPDKIKRSDSQLTKFMQDAKDAYRKNSVSVLNTIYEHVKFYLEQPDMYTLFDNTVTQQFDKAHDPWYEVHTLFMKSDLKNSFIQSRVLLADRLAEVRIELSALESQYSRSFQ